MENRMNAGEPGSFEGRTGALASSLAWTPPGLLRTAPRLSDEEARFVSAAVALILPEPIHAGLSVDAPGFLEKLFAVDADCLLTLADDAGSSEVGMSVVQVRDAYRQGIAAVQQHCIERHWRVFEDLCVRDQHLVLSFLEDGVAEMGFLGHAGFFRLLVRHAAEAYFDATQIAVQPRHL